MIPIRAFDLPSFSAGNTMHLISRTQLACFDVLALRDKDPLSLLRRLHVASPPGNQVSIDKEMAKGRAHAY